MNETFEALMKQWINDNKKGHKRRYIVLGILVIIGVILFITPFLIAHLVDIHVIKMKEEQFTFLSTLFYLTSIILIPTGILFLIATLPFYFFDQKRLHWILKNYSTNKEKCIQLFNKAVYPVMPFIYSKMYEHFNKKQIQLIKEMIQLLNEE